MSSRLFRLLSAAVLVGAAGCAEQLPDINRVQTDTALEKEFFVGKDLTTAEDDPEFWMRGTVVDVSYGAAQDGLFTSTYAQPVSRIRWEITENFLNARLAYERIADSDSKGNKHDGLRKKLTNDGQIVASYRITSHFNIAYSYNPSTGEKQNVVEENAFDQKWYERKMFRVDWSSNLVTSAYDFDTLAMLGMYGGIKYSPLSFSVSDPHDPNAFHASKEEGYLDVTVKALAEPQMIDLSALGWGIDSFPACFLDGDFAGGTAPYGNCNPTELTIRQSFRRVVDNDYEPFDMDGVRFESFGIFTTEYKGYDRQYGVVDDKWFRFASRYNVYERSHYYTDAANMKGAVACANLEKTASATGNPTSDPNRDEDKDGTADECAAAGRGSQCDVFKGKCTLPYARRTPVTIPWYFVSGTTDEVTNLRAQLENATGSDRTLLEAAIVKAQERGEDLYESTNWAVEEWDLAMKTAVQTARLTECRKVGDEGCTEAYPMWKGQQDDMDEAVRIQREANLCHRLKGWNDESCNVTARVSASAVADERGESGDSRVSTEAIGTIVSMKPVIVLCHNPVVKGDHPSCGAVDFTVRTGDLRYHVVNAIEKPQQPSAWGIMVDADDPVTGEKIAASINVWTHVTDMATQGLVDLVRYMNGELTTSEITDGQYIKDWVKAQKVNGASAGGGPVLSEDEVASRLASIAGVEAIELREAMQSPMPPVIRAMLKEGKDIVRDTRTSADVASPQAAAVRARMKGARHTPVEAQLMNPAMIQVAGLTGNLPIEGPIADRVSPLALNNPKMKADLHRMRENALAARGACIMHESPEASSLTGIADIIKAKFPAPAGESALDAKKRIERIARYIVRKYNYAVIAHEMGHSIGLRHNFVSSYASLFFRPQYWQLRTKNGSVTTECTAPKSLADAAKCVGPRYYDPVTSEEQDQLIWMFSQSTVMDYPGDVSQDLIGLGVYDFAAARFFYGDVASVYDVRSGSNLDPKYLSGGVIGAGITAATDTFGGLAGITYGTKAASGNGTDDMHYSQLQNKYKLITDCVEVQPTPPSFWNTEKDGEWHPVMDGHIVAVDGVYKKCRQMPVDYVAYTQLVRPDATNAARGNNPSVDPATRRVRVPYAFATDSWADTGNVSVFRHDAGADPYEQVMFLIGTMENRSIFDNFRRGRSTFSASGAASRAFERYNEKLLGISGGIGFYETIYQDLSANQGMSFATLWPFIATNFQANLIAASISFDHFTRQLSRPESGPHYYRDPGFQDPVLRSDEDTDDYGAGTDFSGAAGGPKNGDPIVIIPTGSTGFLRDVGFGGHPLENRMSDTQGEYSTDYMINAGSYYNKINAAILMSESEDRFVSNSRRDFYDARFRAVGMADVFPDGYRRVLANALTGDRTLLAPRLKATPKAGGAGPTPDLDANGDGTGTAESRQYPSSPVGWVNWWPTTGPKVCFPSEGRNVCSGQLAENFGPEVVDNAHMALVDPQIGWEVQKFLIAYALAYIPANQKATWTDMMRIYRVGKDELPGLETRIEWTDPQSGETYMARTYGKECLFGTGATKAACTTSGGKWVEKGIAARVLEYANDLTAKGYALDTAGYPAAGDRPAGFNQYGRAVVRRHPDGVSIVVPDPMLKDWNATGSKLIAVAPCDQNVTPTCKQIPVEKNRWARELGNYKSVPDYIRDVGMYYGFWGMSSPRGQYP